MAGCFGNSQIDKYLEDKSLEENHSYDIVELEVGASSTDDLVSVEDEITDFCKQNYDDYYLKLYEGTELTTFTIECFEKRGFDRLDDLVTDLVEKYKGKVTFDWR